MNEMKVVYSAFENRLGAGLF